MIIELIVLVLLCNVLFFALGFFIAIYYVESKSTNALVKNDESGCPCISKIELWDYEKNRPLAKEGDIVRILVFKYD